MKIYIPSKGRAKTASTHKFLAGYFDWTFVINSQEEAQEYIREGVPADRILVSNTTGITNARRFIRDQVAKGDWYVVMDDNIKGFKKVKPPFYQCDNLPKEMEGLAEIFAEPAFPTELAEVLHETKTKAELIGAKNCGFAVVDNAYFRTNKWRTVGYVISKVAIIQKSAADYDTKLEAMEDYGFTAENLLLYGKVLINNYLFPVAKHYEEGGIGTYEQRMPRKVKDCAYLMLKYPNLFNYKEKTGCHPKGELQIRFNSEEQVRAWRLPLLKQRITGGGMFK